MLGINWHKSCVCGLRVRKLPGDADHACHCFRIHLSVGFEFADEPFHVAAFMKDLQGHFSPPAVKQHLAAHGWWLKRGPEAGCQFQYLTCPPVFVSPPRINKLVTGGPPGWK